MCSNYGDANLVRVAMGGCREMGGSRNGRWVGIRAGWMFAQL
jgi:hypothetical protein